MKIDNKALKQLYDHYLDEVSPESREKCPAPEMLVQSIRQALPKKKRNMIIGHLSCCIHCSTEFEFLIKTLREEIEIEQKVGQILDSNETLSKPNRRNSVISYITQKKYIYAVAAALIVLFISFYVVKLRQEYEYRRARASPLQLVYPRDTRLPLSKLVFRWNGIPEADHYIIEIFDDTLLPFWRSSRIRENILSPSQSLLDKFEKNKRYFWMVTAYDEKGKSTESRLEDYIIKR
jgi:hypothetical protein